MEGSKYQDKKDGKHYPIPKRSIYKCKQSLTIIVYSLNLATSITFNDDD